MLFGHPHDAEGRIRPFGTQSPANRAVHQDARHAQSAIAGIGLFSESITQSFHISPSHLRHPFHAKCGQYVVFQSLLILFVLSNGTGLQGSGGFVGQISLGKHLDCRAVSCLRSLRSRICAQGCLCKESFCMGLGGRAGVESLFVEPTAILRV